MSLESTLLEKLFINNKSTLRTVYFYDCEHVTDSMFKTLKQHNLALR